MTGFIILLVIVAAGVALIFCKRLEGWRTRIAALVTAVAGGALPLLSEVFQPLSTFDWMKYTDPKIAPWIMLGVGVVFAMLRYATKGPVQK